MDQIKEKACLILLGEPGIGKSTTVAQAVERHKQAGDLVIHVAAQSCSSLDDLAREIFEAAPWKSWQENGTPLYVFLDSLDEGRIILQGNLDYFLSKKFERHVPKGDNARLFLRFICRTAEWAPTLERTMQELWGEGSVETFELIPLTRSDVECTTTMAGVNAGDFVEGIVVRGLTPLATRPITLNMLLSGFRSNGQFPETRRAAYANGCEILAGEESESRQSGNKTGSFTPAQRTAVAARIAAISLLSRNRAFTLDNMASAGVLTASTFVGGEELASGHTFEVTKQAVEETLRSALFTGAGDGALTWTHQTYAEFLAARYLDQKTQDLERLLPLITITMLGERKLVPEFHEVAAWLASMNRALFTCLLSTEPEVLLRSDVATAGNAERKALVANLLGQFESEELHDSYSLRDHFQKLRHPTLEDQLCPFMQDKAHHLLARQVAIEIAAACHLQGLVENLFQVALDLEEDTYLRKSAVHALTMLLEDERLKRLAPLVNTSPQEDPSDELRGLVMKRLWPKYLSALELFQSIAPPRQKNLVGMYSHFLYYELVEGLDETSLLVALRWARAFKLPQNPYIRMGDLVKSIALKAISVPNSGEMLEEFAALLYAKSRTYDHPFRSQPDETRAFEDWIKKDNVRRQTLLELLHNHAAGDSTERFYFVHWFVQKEDFDFIVTRLRSARHAGSERFWAECLRCAFDGDGTKKLDVVLVLSEAIPTVADQFKGWFVPVALGSSLARQMKEAFEHQSKVIPPITHKPLSPESLIELLYRVASGEVYAFQVLLDKFAADLSDNHERVVSRHAWSQLNSEQREHFSEASKAFLLAQDPEAMRWRGTNQFPYVALAGVEALSIVGSVDATAFETFDEACLRRWCPAMVRLITLNGFIDVVAPILPTFYSRVPEEFVEAVLFELNTNPESFGGYYLKRVAEGIWGQRLSDALTRLIRDPATTPEVFGQVLLCLMAQERPNAIVITEEAIFAVSKNADREPQALEAGLILLQHGQAESWDLVWPFVSAKEQRLRSVLARLQTRDREISGVGIEGLTVAQRGQLYRSALDLFPPQRSDEHESGFQKAVEPRAIREYLWQRFAMNPDKETCSALATLVADFPQYPWLKRNLQEMLRSVRSAQWVPIAPEGLMAYLGDKNRRLIRNADELLTVVLELLGVLQNKLSTRSPGSEALWNTFRPYAGKIESARPKDELFLSDFINDFLLDELRARGISVGREEEVKRERQSDILIKAVTQDLGGGSFKQVQVIIEVKGSWHAKVLDIQSELIDRYMEPTALSHGIHLVGYFASAYWDEEDGRNAASRRKVKGCDVPEFKAKLDALAGGLCGNGRVVKAFVLDASLR